VPLRLAASQERPKSAVFPAELKSKMSVEEQNERIRRNQSSSVRDKRRSLNLSAGQSPANYRVVCDDPVKGRQYETRPLGEQSPLPKDLSMQMMRLLPCVCVCVQIRRRLTAHEIDIKDLEVAVRGQGQESPREEIARLRRLKVDPELYDIGKEVRSVESVEYIVYSVEYILYSVEYIVYSI